MCGSPVCANNAGVTILNYRTFTAAVRNDFDPSELASVRLKLENALGFGAAASAAVRYGAVTITTCPRINPVLGLARRRKEMRNTVGSSTHSDSAFL